MSFPTLRIAMIFLNEYKIYENPKRKGSVHLKYYFIIT